MNFSFFNKVLYMCPFGKIPFMNCITQILLIFTLYGKSNIMKTVALKFYMFQCEFFLDTAFLYQFTLHTSIYLNESVKCVHCVVKTCSSASVLTCSGPNAPCLFTCQSVLYALTCSRAIMLWVPCLIRFAWPRDQLPTCFASSVSSFDAPFFSFSAIVVEAVHAVGKV